MASQSPVPPPAPKPPALRGYFIGGLIAGTVAVSLLLCLFYLQCRRSRRDKNHADGLLGIKGVARPMLAGTNRSWTRTPPPFSRQRLTASIIMPEKSITRQPTFPSLSDKTLVSSKLGLFPAPSLSFQRPAQNARSTPNRSHVLSILNPAHPRHSRSSSGFSTYVPSPSPGSPSFADLMSQARPVRQLFEPSLPDELALVKYGESLTVLKTFKDDWCLVCRDAPRVSRRFSALRMSRGDGMDVGLVPAWVFAEPKGGVPTRPFRNASINARCLGHNAQRDAVISWSNFA